MTTENLSTLKINKLKSQAQFDRALADGRINEDELYFIPEESSTWLTPTASTTLDSGVYMFKYCLDGTNIWINFGTLDYQYTYPTYSAVSNGATTNTVTLYQIKINEYGNISLLVASADTWTVVSASALSSVRYKRIS